MPFDVAAARESGYTDREIRDFLNQHFDVSAATNAGYSLEEIGQAVKFDKPDVAQETDVELPVVTDVTEPVSPIREPSPVQFAQVPAVSTGVQIEEPEALPELPTTAEAAVSPVTDVPMEPVTAVATTGPDIPPELTYTPPELIPEIRNRPGFSDTMLGLAAGVALNPLNRAIIKTIAPRITDEDFDKVDQFIKERAPAGAVKVGRFASEIIDIAAAATAVGIVKNVAKKTPALATLAERTGKGAQRLARGGAIGGLVGAGRETAHQLDEADIDMSKILSEGIKEGVMFGLLDFGFGKIFDKIKTGKRLTASEGKEVQRQLGAVTDDMLASINPDDFIFQGKLDKNAMRKKIMDGVSTQRKLREERVFEQLGDIRPTDRLITSAEVATQRTESRFRLKPEGPRLPTAAEITPFRGKVTYNDLPLEEQVRLRGIGDNNIASVHTRKARKPRQTSGDKIRSQWEVVMQKTPQKRKLGKGETELTYDGRFRTTEPQRVPDVVFNVRTKKYSPDARGTLAEEINKDIQELQKLRGGTMNMQKIKEMASKDYTGELGAIAERQQAEIITGVQASRQRLNNNIPLLKKIKDMGQASPEELQGFTSEINNDIRTASSWAAFAGRLFRTFRESAEEAGLRGMSFERYSTEIKKAAEKLGKSADDIEKQLQNVDLTDPDQVIGLWQKYIQPTWEEKLLMYRYVNMLSSPRTHIINTSTNAVNTVMPFVIKEINAGADFLTSTMTGAERKAFAKEGTMYLKGLFRNLINGDAFRRFADGFNKGYVSKLEFADIGTLEGASSFKKAATWPVRLLEASDQFFRTLIQGGEEEAIRFSSQMLGKALTPAQVTAEAERKALYYLFRQRLFPEGQGYAFDLVDKATKAVSKTRKSKNPVIRNAAKFYVPFIETPMNIFKQGIEYSPLGYIKLKDMGNQAKARLRELSKSLEGNPKKDILLEKEMIKIQTAASEQFAKATIGSMITASTGVMAFSGRTTWKAPTDPKLRQAFYASGRRPYSVRIGDNWVSYKYLGPFAYPIMLGAAAKHYYDESGADDSVAKGIGYTLPRMTFAVFSFFGDIPYIQGFGDLAAAIGGDERRAKRWLTSPVRQLVPYTGFQTWVDRGMDEYVRNPQDMHEFLMQAGPLFTRAAGVPPVPALGKPAEGADILGTPMKSPVERTDVERASSVLPVNISPVNKAEEDRFQNLLKQTKMKEPTKEKIKAKIRKGLAIR